MSPITIAAVKEQSGEIPIHAAIHAQLQSRNARHSRLNNAEGSEAFWTEAKS